MFLTSLDLHLIDEQMSTPENRMVSMDTPTKHISTIAGWVARHAERRPDHLALVSRKAQLTWSQVDERTRRVAARLVALGVEPGDRVAVLAQNRPEVIEVQVACALAGAIFTPLNTRLSMPELRRLTDVVEPRVVFHDEIHAVFADELCTRVRRVNFDRSERLSYENLVTGPTRFNGRDGITPDTDAMLIFTSGTSGTPLGAVLTHRQVLANHQQFLQTLPIDQDTVNYAVAPLFHVAGLNTITGPTLIAGGASVFAPGFDPEQALDDIRDFGINTSFMVPTMWGDLVDSARFGEVAAAGLDFALVGGARCPARIKAAMREHEVPFYEGYGMTEAGPMVTLRTPSAEAQRFSVGRPGPFVELRIVGDDDSPLDSGEIGELWVRAPNVMERYWKNPEATQDALRQGGWLATGDIGHISDGAFHLLDRVDDMINSGAEKVYPSETEAVLESHPDVREVAVIGTDHPRWGDVVTAVVVPHQGAAPTLSSLREHAAGKIARYKLPRRMEQLASLPRNGAGKILRREVASMLFSEKSAAE